MPKENATNRSLMILAKMAKLSLAASILLNLVGQPAIAADAPIQTNMTNGQAAMPDMAIDEAMRHEVINTIAAKVRANYVFPDVAENVAKAILASEKRGEYKQYTTAQAFAKALSEQIKKVGHDGHFNVRFSAEKVPEDMTAEQREKYKPSKAEVDKMLEQARFRNFGVEKIERLPTNIAYLELSGFMDAELGGETVSAAMTVAANADALIIDLRKNGGGDPAMVALISSYLFDGDRVHLNDLYYRAQNDTRQYWTQTYVPGRRFGGEKPVYILTSKYTFSAAEEFSNNLKTLKRATIIGETTGGGANPGDVFKVGEHFGMFISTGRAINPITKDNWEGKGVAPDVAVPAAQALLTAQIMAMKPIIGKIQEPWRKTNANKALQELETKLAAMKAEK